MDGPRLELGDVFRRYGDNYRQQHAGSLSTAQRRVMSAIERCRTAALGGHLEQCDQCHFQRIAYNSCGDRHCPKCQSLARAQWIEERQAELLDTQYFHVVFTLPEKIAAIAYQNKEVVYDILFRATSETLRTIAADPKHLGAEIGFFAVLHTWGQNLMFHKQAAEAARKDTHRKKESLPTRDPAASVGRESTAGNDTMQMRVEHQILSPGVQNSEEADLGAQMFAIRRNGAQGF